MTSLKISLTTPIIIAIWKFEFQKKWKEFSNPCIKDILDFNGIPFEKGGGR